MLWVLRSLLFKEEIIESGTKIEESATYECKNIQNRKPHIIGSIQCLKIMKTNVTVVIPFEIKRTQKRIHIVHLRVDKREK